MVEGVDFLITVVNRRHPVLVLAIHGGGIEPFTSDLALAIAGDEYNLYEFRGIRTSNNWRLHIPSTEFAEERLSSMINECAVAISIHGERSDKSTIGVGGLNYRLQNVVSKHLSDNGFTVEIPRLSLRGLNIKNVVNRPRLHGVQLEISRGLRQNMKNSVTSSKISLPRLFASSVRSAVNEYLSLYYRENI